MRRAGLAAAIAAGCVAALAFAVLSNTGATEDGAIAPARPPDPPSTLLTPSTSPPSERPSTPPTPTLFEITEQRLLDLQERKGTSAALSELDALTRNEPEVNRFCHAIAHELGHRALELARGNAARALRDRDDVCGGGYTHGVVELALEDAADPKSEMLDICAPAQDGSCWHGVGHGLMFATSMDPDSATRLCDRAPNSHLAGRCGEGVYMQLFSADLGAHHAGGDPALAQDPALARKTCRSARSPYSANCWFYAPVVWLTANPDAFSAGLNWCADAGSDFAAQICAKGIGSRAVKFHPDDLSIGSAACTSNPALLDACVRGMASYWSVHWKGEVPPGDLCQHLSGRIKKRCTAIT